MSLRFIRLLITFTIFGLFAIARPEPDLKIAVNTTTIESFPVFAAADALSAVPGGPRVVLIPAPNGRNAMAQLVSSSADAATGSETQALLNSAMEPRIRIVVTLAECRYRVVARKDSKIRRASDLRGKKVGVTMNTSSQYYLAGMLEHSRLKESDVRLVALEGQEMPAALAKGEVDAISIWEPHAENALTALRHDAVVLEDPSVYTERFNLNTRTDVLANPAKRSVLVAFLREVARVSQRLRSRPSDLQRSLAPKVGLPPETVLAVWPQFRFPASIPGDLGTMMTQVEIWAAALQKRPARPRSELQALIDSGPLNESRK